MIIVPENRVQQAEVQILNKDVGFVYPGQSVTVKVDAFPTHDTAQSMPSYSVSRETQQQMNS